MDNYSNWLLEVELADKMSFPSKAVTADTAVLLSLFDGTNSAECEDYGNLRSAFGICYHQSIEYKDFTLNI